MYSNEIQRPSTRFKHFRHISDQRFLEESQRQNIVEAPRDHNLNHPTTNRMSRAGSDTILAMSRNDSIIAKHDHQEMESKVI